MNTVDKAVKMNDGTWQNYDQLLISTGCRFKSKYNFRKSKKGFFLNLCIYTYTHTHVDALYKGSEESQC